ncbi:XkdF-like putative serine protease domain-containing protein [Pectinatus frisingensis]|uniref:XkdF-like putative serine protease domain-containing protein n=1 Tax=Pectinatus frisingensis TaxID=865 RepID=UPI0018C6079B|nr:XkdF-like putative serine protease domain-containing protein [Pectinatus frisingensis]
MKFIQKSAPQRYVLGIVYAPDEVDCQEDYSTAPEIEKACHEFSKKLQHQSGISKQMTDGILKALKNSEDITIDITDIYDDIQKGALGINHTEWPDDAGDIVENYIMPCDTTINGEPIKKGTWMMGVVLSPENFQKAQNGELTGFSMGGKGERVSKKNNQI